MRAPARAELGRGASLLAAAVLAGTALLGGAGPAAAAQAGSGPPTDVIVTTTADAAVAAAERAVTGNGGTLGRDLPVVHGFTATIPAAALPAVRAVPGVRSVTRDAGGHLLGTVDPALGYDPENDPGSLSFIRKVMSVSGAYSSGITGKGVDIALIDSGVARVPGLTSGNVVYGPDLSFESQHADVRYADTFGHGTHMASIIAGRDAAGTPASYGTTRQFLGIAPDARIVSLKVAAADGSADVSQVIAAIGWVTQHAHDYGLNIRVLNLSYGVDSTQDYRLDPLSYAVEQAWRRGVTVIVAAGNDGTVRQELASPASDPYVVAVGASDTHGTVAVIDDTVPAFAQRGTAARHVDVIAPGVHLLGLRAPNSYVDQNNPTARVGTRFIRGSGTSQATAVASGIAALALQRYPTATPDQVKYLLMNSATASPATKAIWQGVGVIDGSKAVRLTLGAAKVQTFPAATGLGTLEGARGSNHVTLAGVALRGETDVFGQPWRASAWAAALAANTSWTGGSFNGVGWTGTGWAVDGRWTATTWLATDWTGAAWSSRTWVSRTWAAGGWDSRTWADSAWSSRSWVSRTWADASWS